MLRTRFNEVIAEQTSSIEKCKNMNDELNFKGWKYLLSRISRYPAVIVI